MPGTIIGFLDVPVVSAASTRDCFDRAAYDRRRSLMNGAAWALSTSAKGYPVLIATVIIGRGKIVALDILNDQVRLRNLDLAILDA